MTRENNEAGRKTKRRYTDRTLKLLWGRAAGRCAVTDCRIFVYADETDYDPAVPIGEVAHMHASSDAGPRANPELTAADRNDYENLILLCSTCHHRIDGQKNRYTVEHVRRLKKDHEDWVRSSLPERGRTRSGWTTILLEDDYPVDAAGLHKALEPDYVRGEVFRISAVGHFDDVAFHLRKAARDALFAGDPAGARFAIFPLARVSSCILFGYLLTNRPTIRLFQYHRDQRTWAWPRDVQHAPLVTTECVNPLSGAKDVVFTFDLSGQVNLDRVRDHVRRDSAITRFFVPEPNTGWLQTPDQLMQLAILVRGVFERTLAMYNTAEKWHIFYAGPAPGAVIVGQQLNPTMTPPVQLYEYRHPEHFPSVLIAPR